MLKSRCIFASLALPLLLSVSSQTRAEDLPLDNVAAQSVIIAPSECAMFIWVGYPSRLTFVSIPDEDKAYSSYNGVQAHALSYKRLSDKFGQFATQDLLSETERAMELRLGDPRNIADHVLYETGTMTLAASDGWIRVENAQAVSSCNRTSKDIWIDMNQRQGAFVLPDPFKTPGQLKEIGNATDIAQTSLPQPVRQVPLIVETPIILEAVASKAIIFDTPLPPSEIVDPKIPLKKVNSIPIATPNQYTVQLGAFDSASDAQAAWISFQSNIDYLQDQRHALQFAEIKDKGIFYRLRVIGIEDRARADELCQSLKQDGVDCFVPRLDTP